MLRWTGHAPGRHPQADLDRLRPVRGPPRQRRWLRPRRRFPGRDRVHGRHGDGDGRHRAAHAHRQWTRPRRPRPPGHALPTDRHRAGYRRMSTPARHLPARSDRSAPRLPVRLVRRAVRAVRLRHDPRAARVVHVAHVVHALPAPRSCRCARPAPPPALHPDGHSDGRVRHAVHALPSARAPHAPRAARRQRPRCVPDALRARCGPDRRARRDHPGRRDHRVRCDRLAQRARHAHPGGPGFRLPPVPPRRASEPAQSPPRACRRRA